MRRLLSCAASAVTVPAVTALSNTHLGDIICLPDGSEFTVRAVAALAAPVGSMSGFVIGGELDVLVSAPSRSAAPLHVYMRIDSLPAAARTAHVAAEGAMAYWAPHLPNVAGAMGELLYRVLELRGGLDPIVIVFRNREPVVFVRARVARPGEIRVLHMARPSGRDEHVARHAAIVTPSGVPVPAPAPQPVPQHEPAREPARVPARR